MITPVYKDGLSGIWVVISLACDYEPYLCLGEHGLYCRIEYGRV
jgi:hypothetical protein